MWYRAYFLHGSDKFDLSSGNYYLAEFTPPGGNEAPVFSGGVGFNRRAGSERVDVFAENFDFEFGLHVIGDTQGDVDAAIKAVDNFLDRAGDEKKPLYLCFRPHDYVDMEPLNGQWNASVRLEITWGAAAHSGRYGDGDFRAYAEQNCRVRLNVKPYPLGGEQIVGHALGGVYSDIYPRDAYGRSRGVRVCPARVGKMNNPIFSHSTPTTGWTVEADLNVSKNTDLQYVLFGKQSIQVIKTTETGFGLCYESKTLTTATYTEALYIIKKDKSAVTESDVRLFVNSNPVTGANIRHLGNGFYIVWKSFTGFASAKGFGFSMNSLAIGNAICVCGCDVELGSYPTLLTTGAMRGNVWDSTAHASTSTRTAGQLYYKLGRDMLPDSTFVIVWTPDVNSSSFNPPGGNFTLMCDPVERLQLDFDATNGRWIFFDTWGNQVYQNNGKTFTAGTTYVFHCISTPTGAQLFINGVEVTDNFSASLYGYPTDVWVYLGSDTDTKHIGGIIHAFTPYARKMTAAQVLADYKNMLPLANDRVRIDWLPFNWGSSVDGSSDIRLYNCNDNAARTNWSVLCEVPGSVEAITRIRIDCQDVKLSTNALGGIFLSRMLAPVGYPLARLLGFYGELQGNVDADSSGGQYDDIAAVTTTAQGFPLAIPMTDDLIEVLTGQEVALLCRIADAGTAGALQIQMKYGFAGDSAFESAWKTILSNTAGNFVTRITRFLGFKDVTRGIEGASVAPTFPAAAGFYLFVKRSSGSDNFYGDYYQIITMPMVRIFSESTLAERIVIYDSKTGNILNTNTSGEIKTDLVKAEASDPFEMVPEQDNYIIYAAGDTKRVLGEPDYDDTIAIEEIVLTPRWGLM